MTTALQLITDALLDLTVLGDGEVPSATQASDGLRYLNGLIQSWSNEGLLINSVTTNSLTMTGAASYTFGTSGTFNTARPVTALSAYFSLGGFDYTPVNLITREQYEGISDKTTTSDVPYSVFIEYAYPLATLYVYPVPSSGTLKISSQKPLTELATSGTAISMPQGYERALRLNLAVEMMPQYGYMNALIMQMADKAKKDIKRVNAANNPVITGLGLPTYGRYTRGNVLNGY